MPPAPKLLWTRRAAQPRTEGQSVAAARSLRRPPRERWKGRKEGRETCPLHRSMQQKWTGRRGRRAAPQCGGQTALPWSIDALVKGREEERQKHARRANACTSMRRKGWEGWEPHLQVKARGQLTPRDKCIHICECGDTYCG